MCTLAERGSKEGGCASPNLQPWSGETVHRAQLARTWPAAVAGTEALAVTVTTWTSVTPPAKPVRATRTLPG
jgi:hypothetical protein